MMIQTQTGVTIEAFEAFIARPENQDRRFELIHGEIIEKAMPTEIHSLIVVFFLTTLRMFITANGLGGRLYTEAAHRLSPDAPEYRIPDVSYTVSARVQPVTESGAIPYMPDLCIEIKSPDDTYKGLREKAAFYLSAGVSLVWLVFPEKRLIETYTLNEQAIFTAAANDTIGGGDVLPGLTIAVSEVFNYE